MCARQTEDALNQTDGADATGSERGRGPVLERRPDAPTLPEQAIDEGLLTRRGLRFTGARREETGGDLLVHGHERFVTKDAHEVRVPLHADFLPEQRQGHGVETAVHFDMAVAVHGALASGEDRKGRRGERLQHALLGLDKVRPHLAAGRAMDAQPRNRAIPVPQKRILRLEAVEPAALQRVAFDVPAAPLLLPIFLRVARHS